MRWLLFLSRVAFICGFFFIGSFSLLVYDWAKDDTLTSTIIIIGHVMGMILIPFVNMCYLAVLFIRRELNVYVPAWLSIANFLFLLILVFYIFSQHGQYNH